MSRLALVTGATGVIGPALVQRLMETGYAVRALVRDEPPAGVLPRGIERVRGDILDRAAVERAVAGAEVVFHLAAKLHQFNPSRALRDEYERVNVVATKTVAESARAAGVRRLVFFSTIAVYGHSQPGEVLNEDSPVCAGSLYAWSKQHAEAAALAVRADQGEPLAVVLRIAGVYGPRMKGNYRQLVRWLERGWFVMIGPGLHRRTLVYVRDVADAAVIAAEHPAAPGRTFNVTDGRVHTFREIVNALSELLGRRAPRLELPVAPARMGARAADAALRLCGRSGRASPLLEKLLEDMAVSGRRIQETLGFRPQFDLGAGWRETLPRLTDP